MKTSSRKSKGRRACAEVKELMHKYAPDIHDSDIVVTSSGDTGPDLKLSHAAFQKYPFAVEVKNQESISIWAAIEQAKSHLEHFNQDTQFVVPTVFFKRNRSDLMICLSAEDFFKLIS